MRGSARRQLPARQRGIALLALMALFSVVVLFAFISGLNRSASSLAQTRALATPTALAQAKEALIAYAVTYKDTHDTFTSYNVPGYLPCPDMGPTNNVEGTAASGSPYCGAFLVSVMGKLPWKTLGLDTLRDGSGECLWYAVSGAYKNNPNGVGTTNANMMNWDTNGQFKVFDTDGATLLTGSSADNQAVAVIFAPGAPHSGQNRAAVAGTENCGGNYTAAAYLDTANGINNSTLVTPSSPGAVTDVSSFIAGAASATFNDQLVYITRADIWNAIKKRSDFNNNLRALTRRAAQCVKTYGTNNGGGANDRRLPWAAAVAMSSLDRYAVNRRYRDISNTDAGRLADRVDDSARNYNPKNLLTSYTEFGYTGYLLFTENVSYCAYTKEEKIWYDNWKDHLFYGVANKYNPSASQPTAGCTSTTCLKISDGVNTYSNYAAVVIFAGEKLSTQNRNTLSEKSQISNYLEGSNTSANASGNNTYLGGGASSTFNDFVYAISETTLAVSCYDAASGTMIAAPSPSAACP